MRGSGGCGPAGRGRGGQFMDGPMQHMPWFGGARIGFGSSLAGIDLTDEQIERIAELKQSAFSRMGHGRVDKMELMQALFKELGNAEINRDRVGELKQKIKEQKAAMAELLVDNMLSFAEILTPEQRKKIRLKKIRQFLGSDEHEHDHEHGDEHGHEHGHRPPDPRRHRHE